MLTTLPKGCRAVGLSPKKTHDDATIIRKNNDGLDFFGPKIGGVIHCDLDDTAALLGYADLRRASYPVKLAGSIAVHLRQGMRADPKADQISVVSLINGFKFARPPAELDLSSGWNSGHFVGWAMTFDVRNLRNRVKQALAADNSVGGEDDDA